MEAMLTAAVTLSHPRAVTQVASHAVALILALATAVGNLAVCGGWKATPQARMACCAEGVACPMRAHREATADAPVTISQQAADSCCASSERDDATLSTAYVLAAHAAVAVLPIPALSIPRTWQPPRLTGRFESPPPSRAVARHLLLSVILV